jgi:hypothetical protein
MFSTSLLHNKTGKSTSLYGTQGFQHHSLILYIFVYKVSVFFYCTCNLLLTMLIRNNEIFVNSLRVKKLGIGNFLYHSCCNLEMT